MKNILLCALLGLTLAMTGCATTVGAPVVTQEAAIGKAKEVFGESYGYIFIIPVHGGIADAVFVSMSKTAGPSKMARDYAEFIKGKVSQKTKITVIGPNSAKSAQVICDALNLVGGDQSNLEVLFIGDENERKFVERVVQRFGGKFYFKSAAE